VILVLEDNLVPREHQAWMETKEYLATEENLVRKVSRVTRDRLVPQVIKVLPVSLETKENQDPGEQRVPLDTMESLALMVKMVQRVQREIRERKVNLDHLE